MRLPRFLRLWFERPDPEPAREAARKAAELASRAERAERIATYHRRRNHFAARLSAALMEDG